MTFVLDSTVTLAWAFHEDGSRCSNGSDPDAVLERLLHEDARVPGIWPFEVTNGLWLGQRKGRLHQGMLQRFVALLASLPIEVDAALPLLAYYQILPLARERGLTVYEAAYLELATRTGAPLATHSIKLVKAAGETGVPLL